MIKLDDFTRKVREICQRLDRYNKDSWDYLNALLGLRNMSREIADAFLRQYEECKRLEELNDKFKWQVRDTCRRAEKAEARVKELREAIINFDTIFHDMCQAGDAGVFGDNETKTLAKAISRYQKAVQAASIIAPASMQDDEKE